MRPGILAFVFGSLWLPLQASAQIEAGDFHLSAGIAAVAHGELEIEDVDLDTTSASIGSGGVIRLGYATSETFELGLNLGIDHEEIEIGRLDADATSLAVGPYVALNLPINPGGSAVFSPIVGLGYSGLFSDAVDVDAFFLELGTELKFFVANDASIDLGFFFQYETGEAEVDGVFGDLDADGFTLGPRLKISIWP